jgi:membrane-bound serine protease (ClpP class)
MRSRYFICIWVFLATSILTGYPAPLAERDTAEAQPPGVVHVVTLDGVISPVTSDYILNAIENAEEAKAQCLIIQLDTPGGLMEPMRDMIKGIMGADVPVVVYVAPSGAGAVSAGVFITLSAHFAVMTTGTNIGAAHPVAVGGVPGADTSNTMMEKVTNDAVAYIQSIAEKRGRNADWAREAVEKSVSITALEALEKGVIDTIATSLTALLDYLDGRQVEVLTGTVTLNTGNARVEQIDMSLRYRILDRIANPNIAYILLLLGIYGLFFELSNPGAIFPGVLGAVCLILAFVSFQMLPINYAGLALIVLSIVLFILEVNVTSYGLLSIGGIAALLLGSLMLFESPDPIMRVSWRVLLPAVIFTALFFIVAIGFALKAQRRKAFTGSSGLIGLTGVAQSDLDPEGRVLVHGEIWKAVSEGKIKAGSKVRIVNVEGMILQVEGNE